MPALTTFGALSAAGAFGQKSFTLGQNLKSIFSGGTPSKGTRDLVQKVAAKKGKTNLLAGTIFEKKSKPNISLSDPSRFKREEKKPITFKTSQGTFTSKNLITSKDMFTSLIAPITGNTRGVGTTSKAKAKIPLSGGIDFGRQARDNFTIIMTVIIGFVVLIIITTANIFKRK